MKYAKHGSLLKSASVCTELLSIFSALVYSVHYTHNNKEQLYQREEHEM